MKIMSEIILDTETLDCHLGRWSNYWDCLYWNKGLIPTIKDFIFCLILKKISEDALKFTDLNEFLKDKKNLKT